MDYQIQLGFPLAPSSIPLFLRWFSDYKNTGQFLLTRSTRYVCIRCKAGNTSYNLDACCFHCTALMIETGEWRPPLSML